ncbi:MAG: endonuclease/exonuclease/phosphatase family protein [Planctomycetia bacterium]|nr:endonuclease/exonuclease/phosphatase family protein [Planctomycetia bacterium]
MNRRSFLTGAKLLTKAALLICLASLMTGALYAQENVVRLMSYNVCNGKGLDGKTDYNRLADVILKENPDLIAIQELDQKTKRSKGVDVLETLGELTKMYPSYGPAIDYQGGKYGIGILSKEKPIKVEYFPLPGREEQRCLLVVEFEKCVFCCSHWSLTKEDRAATHAIVTSKMKEQSKPVFICGDFNATPQEDSIKNLQKDWTILSADDVTFPANKPTIRIDYICVADPTNKRDPQKWLDAVKDARVVNEPVVSDHRPIVVDLDPAIFE